ncbi:conjugal transfer protein TraF [Marinimicrobium alkaliphilum]|uniref:conjugal transfer protein TraF n=1 Tax=Marinimicrobium alkaliphilum TaxID=2202654 RepID=UPI0013002459|nr:conjugal transfer protein TraF [Marinimicrobium alkaliphilum]
MSFDARSVSMGGSGVVTARSHNASLFNPALLIDHDPRRQTRLHGHSYVGARLIDRDNFLATAQDFRDRYRGMSLADLIDSDIDISPTEFEGGADLRNATSAIRAAQDDINGLSDRPLRASASYGFAFGYPVGHWALGGYHREYAVLGSVVRVAEEDNHAINQVTGTIDAFANVLDELALLPEYRNERGMTLAEVVDRASGLMESVQALDNFIDFRQMRDDVRADDYRGRNVQDYLREPLPEEFLSSIETRGAQVTEQALSLARSFPGRGRFPGDLHVGITLKDVEFTSIHYTQLANEYSLSDYSEDAFRRTHNRFNMDVGLLYDLSGHWQVGLVVRNLVPYDFEDVAGDRIPLRPLARAGIGYRGHNVRLSLDADLSRNEPLGFDPDKQYVSLGAEWFAWRNTALRAGVRTNVVDGATLPSLGVGLGGRHGHFDVAVARSFNGDEYGLGLQAGLAF